MTRTAAFRFLILALLMCAYYALSLPVVRAEGDIAGTTTREEVNARAEVIKEKIEERQADIASTTNEVRQEIQEHKDTLQQKIQDRVYNLLSNITRRMDAAVGRLQNIAGRMDSRAQKLQDAGADVSQVREHIAAAKTKLDAASAILDSDLSSFTHTGNPREAFVDVKAKLSEAKVDIRSARDELIMALIGLKAAARSVGSDSGVSEAVSNASSTNASSTAQ